MLKLRCCFNGVQDLFFIHGFRQLVLYSTSTSAEANPNIVNYLVQNLGFSEQQALSTSSKFTHNRQARGTKEVSDFDLVNNAASVITFLKKIGLQQSHIRSAIKIYPQILMSNVDRTLIPKTENFQKLGFSESDISEIISRNPSLCFIGFDTTLVPAIQALKDIMGCEANHVIPILKELRFYNLAAIPKCLVPNVELLHTYGIPFDSIRKFLLRIPYFLLRDTDYFRQVTITVERKFGIPRTSPQFLNGVKIVASLTDNNIDSKLQVYKTFGWTDSHIATLLSLNPCILGLSKDVIRKKLDFLMNVMGYEPNYLASKACLFTCSLEKRVVPRHKVLIVLKENGLIRKDYSLPNALVYTESKFLKKFVLPFKQVHQVYSKNAGISLEMLTLASSESKSSVV